MFFLGYLVRALRRVHVTDHDLRYCPVVSAHYNVLFRSNSSLNTATLAVAQDGARK